MNMERTTLVVLFICVCLGSLSEGAAPGTRTVAATATSKAKTGSEPGSGAVQDKYVVEAANFYFEEVNAAAARTSTSKSPLVLGLRLILEATKTCTDAETSCVYRMVLNAWGSDNRVRNIQAEVWRKADGTTEILSSREVPLNAGNSRGGAVPFADSAYEAAVEFYLGEVNTASRMLAPERPRLLHSRRIIKSESSCGPTNDCMLRIIFNCDVAPDNRVMDMDLKVWRHPDGKMELVGAEELPPSPETAVVQSAYAAATPAVEERGDFGLRSAPYFFVVRPMFIIAGASSMILTVFLAFGALAFRRQRNATQTRAAAAASLLQDNVASGGEVGLPSSPSPSEARAFGTHVMI